MTPRMVTRQTGDVGGLGSDGEVLPRIAWLR
jgi:hypothetical protein